MIAAGTYAGVVLDPVQAAWAQRVIDRCRATPDVTDRDTVCALACVQQESRFYMYANDGTSPVLNAAQKTAIRASLSLPHDRVGHDSASVGLFQQQPYIPGRSWGWGAISQCMDVSYSTNAFLQPLLKILNRPSKAVTMLVQTVQRSAFPLAYARWEPLGWALLAAGGGTPPPPPAPPGQHLVPMGGVSDLGGFGAQVRMDQLDLIDTGFPVTGGADGDWGPASAAAAKAFQRAAGLVQDGEVGPVTRAAIRKVPSWRGPVVSSGGYSDLRWQQELRVHGWRIAADGIWGPHSVSILRQFQAERRLAQQNGIRSSEAWAALFTRPL